MATYRTIAATETDPLAPIVSALMKALEMNPRAMFEGATGAPRLWLPAVERLVAGTSVRFRADGTITTNSTTFGSIGSPDLFLAAFMQAGTVTISLEGRRDPSFSGIAGEARVIRRRAGSNGVVGSAFSFPSTTFTANSWNVDVQPGDLVFVQMRSLSASATVEVRNRRMSVDAASYYWPTSNFGEIEGNPTLAIP
jgi:hypothetical protein